MSKWMTTGIWAAHFAALVSRVRSRSTIERLETRLGDAQERLIAAEQRSAKSAELLADGERRLACAEELLLRTATQLTELEGRLADAEARWSQAQPQPQPDGHAYAEPVPSAPPSAWEGFRTYVRREIDSLFDVMLVMFFVLCASAAINIFNGRDVERLLDFLSYFLPLLAAMVAGLWLVFNRKPNSPVDPGAFSFKLSALLLMCGGCVYLALKDSAVQSFYVAGGFAALVFSSRLMIGLKWVERESWGVVKKSKALLYVCLWLSAVAVAVPWAWMVSSEHPGAEFAAVRGAVPGELKGLYHRKNP
ncbi:hypothetical protein [Stenotrophomonas maltophilia]|uniref:hypothetical protein n=1 Tax=Stenotrophomonas maltophilia TaxID=40324 RepID=UPI001F275C02|nr:hypothetical protein [Stenotrophomonas maltophilia]MCF3525253.1 hypothetical protein [Stenotrophomonas maltophilia]MCF3554423.1 hypothetical protein [Stenotrophomonas maltophilia]